MLLIAYPSWILDTSTTEQLRSATASTGPAAIGLLLRMTFYVRQQFDSRQQTAKPQKPLSSLNVDTGVDGQ